jgi:drug/metabolite transporter (DMT)-like permease
VSGGALGLALGAAFLHALWNLLLAGSRNSVAATGALLIFGTVLLAPAALVGGGVSTEALPFIAASAALELAYFVLLARAYRGGELSVVYPIARGSAPVFVLAVAALGLGKGVSGLAAAGVVLVAAGVLLVGLRRVDCRACPAQADKVDTRRSGKRRDAAFGLAIGVTIAGYTLVDSEGLDHADPLPYLFLIAAVCAAAYTGGLLASGRGPDLKAELNVRGALTAAATFCAYAMVLAAFELAPPAPVAAVRESSIVIAALMAWLFLGEERRLGGAMLVAAGVALIAYS